MEKSAYYILKQIISRREMTLGHIISLLPKKYKDHRDLYPFVSLITGGYIDSIMSHDGQSIGNAQCRELAVTLYTATFGKGEHEYFGQKLVNGGDFKSQIFFSTAKGMLALEEHRQRRSDRIFAMVIGIVVGIITSISTSFLKMRLGL